MPAKRCASSNENNIVFTWKKLHAANRIFNYRTLRNKWKYMNADI